jgi:hypothetical protein
LNELDVRAQGFQGLFLCLKIDIMKNIYYLIEITKHHCKTNDMNWYAVVYSNGLDLIDKEYAVGEAIPTIILK